MSRGRTGPFPGEVAGRVGHPGVLNAINKVQGPLQPGQLSQKQMDQYITEGFVVLPQFFEPEELQPVRDACAQLVDEVALKLQQAGKIKNVYKEHGLFDRLTKICEEFPGAVIVLFKLGSQRFPKAFRDLWSHPKLLNLAEQILGTKDISGNPVWNFRPKIPKNDDTTVPWHQDNGYYDDDGFKMLIMTTWIPLLSVNEQNGCMQMVRHGHRTGKVARHTNCWGDTWYVDLDLKDAEQLLGVDMTKDVVTCDMPYGSILLFNNFIPHRSLSNKSNEIRWSLDLRWQRSDQPTGFYGLLDGVKMRSASDPTLNPDWGHIDVSSRYKEVSKVTGTSEDELDLTMTGPWMDRWEVTNPTRHTEAYFNKMAASKH